MTFNNCRFSRRFLLSACAALVCCLPAVVSAGIINYGDYSDMPPGVVEYQNVSESGTEVPPPHYGAPTAIGNSLHFLNITGDFQANPQGADSDETLDVRLNTRLMTFGDGNGLDSLEITEFGTYQHVGLANSDALTSAALQAFVTVLAVDGTPLTNGDVFTIDASNSFSSSIAGNGQVVAGNWDLGLLIEFVPYLIQEGYGPDSLVTKAQVVIDNRLTAIETPGASAFIDKKGFKITPGGDLDENVVPEPATACLALIGVLGLVGRRRWA